MKPRLLWQAGFLRAGKILALRTKRRTGRLACSSAPGQTERMPILSVRDLHKSYDATVAVDGLSFEIEAGEIFGLLGPNGAGKSTTIGLVVGLLQADSGSIVFSGLEGVLGVGSPEDPNVRRRLGVAPQALALYEDLTALENLTFFGKVQGVSAERLPSRLEWALELAGLEDVRFDRVSTFSGGMKRRLNLAVAIIHEPQLVLLDEPTVGVDPQSRIAIFERVSMLKEAGCTVVYTTHYMEEAQRLCDRIAIVDSGRLIGLDTVPRLIQEHGGQGLLTVTHADGEEVIHTNEPVDTLTKLKETTAVQTFGYQPPDLESVFLNLTGRALRD